MRCGGEHGLERRASPRLQQLRRAAAGLEPEVLPIGERHSRHGLVPAQAVDVVGQPAQAGERDVEHQRMALGGAAPAALEQLRQLAPDARQRQRPARPAPQQGVDRHAVHPRLVEEPAAVGALEQRMGGDQPHDRAGRRAADGVDAHVDPMVVADALERGEQRGARARLVRAERGTSRQRQADAQSTGHWRHVPGSARPESRT